MKIQVGQYAVLFKKTYERSNRKRKKFTKKTTALLFFTDGCLSWKSVSALVNCECHLPNDVTPLKFDSSKKNWLEDFLRFFFFKGQYFFFRWRTVNLFARSQNELFQLDSTPTSQLLFKGNGSCFIASLRYPRLNVNHMELS